MPNRPHPEPGPGLTTAGAVCRLLAERAEHANQPGAPALHIYGANPQDPIMHGADHITTAIYDDGPHLRWFHIEITEFNPDNLPPWQQDLRVSLILTNRHKAHRSRSR